jgi:subtilisin family serine protease/subtilisin-like proprotein convertase family protein
MKRIIILLIILLSIAFMFSFKSGDIARSEVTNYYYFQGEKWYYDTRTDMVFVKLNSGVTSSMLSSAISDVPEIDRQKVNVVENKSFIPLKSKLGEQAYTTLIDRLKEKDVFESVGYVFSPKGVDDGRTFYGMSSEFIVQFKDHLNTNQIAAINENNRVEIIKQLDVTGGLTYLMKVKGDADLPAIDMANKYYLDGISNYAEPDLYCTNTLCDTTNDQYFWWQWAIRNLGNNVPSNPPNVIPDADMDVDSAWMVTQGDSTIKIAIIDTGVDTNHVDLEGNMTHGLGWNCADDNPWAHDHGHGTSCAGIAAGVGNNTIGITGIAYKCKIIPYKAIAGISAYHFYACAFTRAWQNGADVISNSWGQVGGASSLLYNAISDAARYGRGGKGCVICFASGNENTSPMRFPAIIHPDIIVVGGLTPCNKRKSPTDGCSGETWGASFGHNLDVVAPCVKIYATAGGDTYTPSFNGTSSATPNTAGVCALMLSANPNLTRKEVEAYLYLTAEKVGPYTYDSVRTYGNWNQEMGYGRVNARLALALMLTGIDKVAPYIYHDTLQYSSNDSLTRTVKAIIKDNRKVAEGSNAPRLYYRVGSGSFSFDTAFSVVGDTFQFHIPGQSTGSVVEYYFAAQDTVSPANVSTLPDGGSGSNPPGTTPPSERFSYTVGKYKVAASTTTPKICPNNSTIYDTITIAPFSPNNYIIDVDVRINISHRSAGDVDLFLLKNSSQSELTTDNGGSGDSYVNTVFDDEATIPITSGSVPFTGRFRPETPLTVFDGQTVEGEWILKFTDDASGDYGTLDSWMLEITYANFIGGVPHTITIPSKFALYQSYPNPFNPIAKIRFDIPKETFVELRVYDIIGREAAVLVNGITKAGIHTVEFDGTNFASGVYFYWLKTGNFNAIKKMVLVK